MGATANMPRYVSLRPSGSNVGVHFSAKHGKGLRYDTVTVPIADIVRCADAYRGCMWGEDSVDGGQVRSAGHATWHVDNPKMPIPCSHVKATSPPPDLAQLARNYFGLRDKFDAMNVGDLDFHLIGRLLDEAAEALRKAAA